LARDFGSWEAGIAALEDATGRPGPAGWQVGSFDEGHAEDPVGGVSWYEATAYCASVGKRLPTLFHWSLATGGATDAWGEVVVMSNFGGEVRPVSDSQGLGGHGTYDMAGNVAEWTSTEARDGARYSLGGGWNDRGYLYSETPSRLPDDRSADRGFRCASFDAGDDDPVLAAVPDPVHDFADREFVTDAVFEEWRSFYQYDPLDLDARTESVDPGIERFDRETVSFTTPYGERMTALVFLPRGVEPPYQAVVYSPGGTAYVLRSSETLPDLAVGDFVLRSGRAFVYPMYRGSYERGWAEPTRGPADRRERSVQQTQDLMRTVDYLIDRDDIDGDRLAYLGVSAGAEYGPNSVAIESRFRAAIWVGAGYDPTHMQHEQPFVVPWNYAPHVTVPVLILNGSQDWAIPVETGQMPMVEDLGTPEEHKRHQIFDAGHIPTQTEIIRESLDWLDRYLGPVGG
jgi:dienelactone hydrolase